MEKLTYNQFSDLDFVKVKLDSEIAVYADPDMHKLASEELYCFELINATLEALTVGQRFVRLDWGSFIICCNESEWSFIETQISAVFHTEGVGNPYACKSIRLCDFRSAEAAAQELQLLLQQECHE